MVIFGGLLSLAIGFGLFELDIEEWDAQTKACILYYGGELMGVFGGICISTDGRRYCGDAGIGGGWAMLVLCGCLVSATGLYRCRINYMTYIDAAIEEYDGADGGMSGTGRGRRNRRHDSGRGRGDSRDGKDILSTALNRDAFSLQGHLIKNG